MIRFVKYEAIDKQKWDDCILHAFNGNVYGLSWYLDIVAEQWDALVEGDYDRVFPITRKKVAGIHLVYQPFFTQQLGVFSRSLLTRETVSGFLSAIPDRFKYIDILLNTYNKTDEKEYTVMPQVNHELDLIKSYENLYQSFSQNLKRNLRKAEQSELTMVKNINPETLVNLFRTNKGKEIGHLNEYHYRRMKRLIYTCLHRGAAGLYGVFSGLNQLCAGACFIQTHRKSVFLFSGLSKEGRELGAMPFLISSYLKENAGKHLTLDFDGSNDPNLARFYKSFGSRQTSYTRLIINRLPWYLSVPYQLYKRIK